MYFCLCLCLTRHGCLALANMALSPAMEVIQVFESKGLIDRIIKMAARKEIETQREVIALIRYPSTSALQLRAAIHISISSSSYRQ